MNKQAVAVIVGAIVLFAVAVIGAMAFTGSSSGDKVHTMPGGSMMTGPMDDDSMMTGMETAP